MEKGLGGCEDKKKGFPSFTWGCVWSGRHGVSAVGVNLMTSRQPSLLCWHGVDHRYVSSTKRPVLMENWVTSSPWSSSLTQTSKTAFLPGGGRALPSKGQVHQPPPACPDWGSCLPGPSTHPRVPRQHLGLRPGGIPSALPGSDSPGIRPDWFPGADNPPRGTRQATLYSFNFGHNSDLWAVCVISPCCQNSMNLFPKVSGLYFSISFQTHLHCLLYLFSCKNEWPIC